MSTKPLSSEEIARIATWAFNGSQSEAVTRMRDGLVATIRSLQEAAELKRTEYQHVIAHQQLELSYAIQQRDEAHALIRDLSPRCRYVDRKEAETVKARIHALLSPPQPKGEK